MPNPPTPALPEPQEMDDAHRERVCRLLFETGRQPSGVNQDTFIAAYRAVLLKDLVWSVNELLSYKQAERY